MLLGASSHNEDAAVDLSAVTAGAEVRANSGVPGAALLLGFVDAVVGDGPIDAARDALLAEFDATQLVDVAAVIGNFERMTRIADGAGIALDERMVSVSIDVRERLVINAFGSAELTLGRPTGAD